MIFLKDLFVQIVGAACGRAPAEANVWDVTGFSRWASMGRGQLRTKCSFLETQAFGGLFTCAGNSAACRGQETQTNGESAPSQNPTVSLGGGGVAV